jgi:hypothetical protein
MGRRISWFKNTCSNSLWLHDLESIELPTENHHPQTTYNQPQAFFCLCEWSKALSMEAFLRSFEKEKAVVCIAFLPVRGKSAVNVSGEGFPDWMFR